MVATQDVSVQLSMGVIGEEAAKPNYMDNVPIYLYVDGVPRYFSEGSGDYRVKIYVDGFHVYVTFVTTGIQVHVQVRPFQSDPHGGIMNNKDGEIPGSFSTYLCLPTENDRIVNVMGLLGTPTESMDDNFMSSVGVEMSKPSNLKDYCEAEWCVTDATDTVFTFETGYDFSYFNKCGAARRDRSLYSIPKHDARQLASIEEICALVGDVAEDLAFCMEEADLNGATGARTAVLSIKEGRKFVRDSEAGKQPDDDRCCSVDYKHCMAGCEEQNRHFCSLCDANAIFFKDGPNDTTDGPNKHCKALGQTLQAGEFCCPGLEDVDGSCAVKAVRRNLGYEDFKMVRPDIPAVRNIVPLHSEL